MPRTTENRLAFGPDQLARLEPLDGQPTTFWDVTVTGLGCRVSVGRGGRINRRLILQLRLAGGRQLKLGLGDVGTAARNKTTFEATVARAVALKHAAASGRDPRAELREEARKSAGMPTVAEYAKVFGEEIAPGLYADGGRQARQAAARAVKAFGHLKLTEVRTVEHVEALRDKIAAEVGGATANRTVSHIAAMYREARRRGIVPKDCQPTKDIKRIPDVPREVVLTPEEAGQFYRGIAVWEEEMAAKPSAGRDARIHGDCLRLAMLTTCRRGEAQGARWDEIEGDQWVRAPERNKNRTASRTRLSSAALEIIERARARREANAWMQRGKAADFIFPSLLSATGHVVSLRRAFAGAVAAAGLQHKGLTIHDLRAAGITFLLTPAPRGAGLTRHQVKAISGHKSYALIDRVYARFHEDAGLRDALAITDAIWTGLKDQEG